METDKENQQQQMLSRKAPVPESSVAPRTPFSAVNRQSAYRTDASNTGQKTGHSVTKQQGKRRTWAHECQPAFKLHHDGSASQTPVRAKGLREQSLSLRRQVVEMRVASQLGEETLREGTPQHQRWSADREHVEPGLTCILPPSPVLYLPDSQTYRQGLPTTSASCPEVLSSRTASTRQSAQSLSPESSSPETADTGVGNIGGQVGEEELPAVGFKHAQCTTVSTSSSADQSAESGAVACAADNGMLVVERQMQVVVVQRDSTASEPAVQDDVLCSDESSGLVSAQKVDAESFTAVQFILEEILVDALNEISHSISQSSFPDDTHEESGGTESTDLDSESLDNSRNETDSYLPLPATIQSESYMAEYTRFVALYISESEKLSSRMTARVQRPSGVSCDQSSDSPSASGASSESDLTASSFVLDTEAAEQNSFCGTSDVRVVLDSLGSYIFDADESVPNSEALNRHLSFTDGETPKSNWASASQSFVRPSVSRFDLTKESEEVWSPWKSFSDECQDESELLNLSVGDQKVTYFSSPPLAAAINPLVHAATGCMHKGVNTAACSPVTQHQSGANTAVDGDELDATATAKKTSLTVNVHTASIGLSPMSVSVHEKETATEALETTDADTMTLTVDVHSVALSPLSVSVRDRGMGTDPSGMSDANTMTQGVDATSIALSPMLAPMREKQTETDVMETVDVDTMTLGVQTFDVALSPVAVSVRSTDTMTTCREHVEVAMATDTVECQDHSMLATTEVQEKTTMTDGSGTCHVHTTMTPLKVLVKQGRRMTSDDVRKQHPRTLANQLDTLTVCNTRLQTELKSAHKDQAQLKVALKEAKAAEEGVRKELTLTEEKKEREWTEKETQYKENISDLEQRVAEGTDRITALNSEAKELREALEVVTQRHTQEIADLEARCQAVEEHRQQAAHQYEEELHQLRTSHDADSYRRRFELAQQLVREREAELTELRTLFADLEQSAQKQMELNAAFQVAHEKVIGLARENKALRDTVHKQRVFYQEERVRHQTRVSELEEHTRNLSLEADNLRQTMALNNDNLSELEKLYSGSSSDFLMATGQVIQLNSDLFGARKAMQELLLSKDALAKRGSDLQDELEVLQRKHAALTETLAQTESQLQLQNKACEDLKKLNSKIKRVYEERFENLALGIENLQRTLDNRETDIDHLEKDLYECRNIIVEQRYKIDGLESELRRTRDDAAKGQSNDDDVQFFKESNAFLEAERSLYVESLRDLEDKLKVSTQEVNRQQQFASEAQCRAAQLEQENGLLQSQVTEIQTHLSQSRHTLAVTEAEHTRAESVAMTAASDLLRKMNTVLNGLRKKISMQEMPDSSAPTVYQHHRSQAASAKHKRQVRKSFVSKILGAVLSPERIDAVTCASEVDGEGRNTADYEKHDMNDVVAVMNGSGDATGTGASVFSVLDSMSPDKMSSRRGARQCDESIVSEASLRGLGLTAADLSLAYSLRRDDANSSSAQASTKKSSANLNLSSASTQSRPPSAFGLPAPRFIPSQSSAFTSVHSSDTSSSNPLVHAATTAVHSTGGHKVVNSPSSHPPALPPSRPPTSGVAKIRTLPRMDRRSAPVGRSSGLCEDVVLLQQSGLFACVLSLEEVFTEISRLASILDHAMQLSLQDLREEKDMLRERSVILEQEVERDRTEREISRQEAAHMETTISQLRERNRQMSEHMMSLTDHKFEVKRLSGEVKRLQSDLEGQRREKEILATELEAVLRRIENPSSTDGCSVQARCVRDIIALRKKNHDLLVRLDDQKEHYEEMGNKAARRMRVLEGNWRKAEDEVYRFDELVENIRGIAESRLGSPTSCVQDILQLINGGISSSQV